MPRNKSEVLIRKIMSKFITSRDIFFLKKKKSPYEIQE